MKDYGTVQSAVRPEENNEQNQKTQADLEYLAMMTEVELE